MPTIVTTTCCHVCAPVLLEKRGLSHRRVIARFAIGFAPGWDNVLKRFGGNPENRQSLIDAGMLVT
ncbi:hypothetical protein ACVXHA_06360 [Escherichia coli]